MFRSLRNLFSLFFNFYVFRLEYNKIISHFQLGSTPLDDNEPTSKYIYEILVFTGNKANSGTDSKVFEAFVFNLS